MKFLLAAVNAKYIHSNLGVYSLKAYAERQLFESGVKAEIEIGEYTINAQTGRILEDIYKRRPAAVGFSCYIWNITCVLELVRELPKVLPNVEIWLGGPEVSWDAERILKEYGEVRGVICGEGERAFAAVAETYAAAWENCPEARENRETARGLSKIPGVTVRRADGSVCGPPPGPPLDMDTLPFPYGELEDFQNRIIYYESSRGCPFSCSYCLSSLEKSVRFKSVELVKKELDFFLSRRVPQVKFVDRTFNCKKSHTMEIWDYIREHDNGITNFHFEISADLLDDEEIDLIGRMRPGLIQLEIGVQTVNPRTLSAIRRNTDMEKLAGNVEKLKQNCNVHRHLDLIAGLPWEGYKSFRNSFNQVWAMEPEQLQLGFLKVLKGSYMEEKAGDYGLLFQSQPPYEVLSTKWLDYGELIRLKGVEEMTEVYYNSGQFLCTLKELQKEFESPFEMLESIAGYYEENGLCDISHSRAARYEILERFISGRVSMKKAAKFRELLVYDLYLRENVKSRPGFAGDQSPYKEKIRDFYRREAESPRYLNGYEGYDSRQLAHMTHLEFFEDGRGVLFDYRHRDALTYNAAAWVIEPGERPETPPGIRV